MRSNIETMLILIDVEIFARVLESDVLIVSEKGKFLTIKRRKEVKF